MANYRAFLGAIRPGNPGSTDGYTFYYPIYADVLVVRDDDEVQIPGDLSDFPGGGFFTLSSSASIEYGDTVDDLRDKIIDNFYQQYPQIDQEEDAVDFFWLAAAPTASNPTTT